MYANPEMMFPYFQSFNQDLQQLEEFFQSQKPNGSSTLGSGNVSIVQSPTERSTLMNCCSLEQRQEKLNRYRSKKTRRNFGRKIKHACQKALADSQPRVRGRFAKTE